MLLKNMSKQNNIRLDVLYRKHNEWLRKVTWNICRDVDMTDELVAELYCYLAEKGNEKIYYLDSFNLGYCRSFIQSRFYNKCKVNNRFSDYEPNENIPQSEYDVEFDESLDNTYTEIKQLLKSKNSDNDWVSAKIAELYYFGKGFTIESLAKEVGVSKSTVFLHIKSMRKQIKKNIKNPFDNKNE